MNIANQIRVGEIDIGIGGGVESMSMFSMQGVVDPSTLSDQVFENENARNCMQNMGVTAENVATKYGITRQQCDQMGVESHAKAVRAQKEGWPADEITPYETIVTDKEGNEKTVIVDRDCGVRPGTSLATLGKLKTVFKKENGTTTAATSSQVSDGAAVVLMARRSVAIAKGLPIMGRIVSFKVVGCPPEIMGIGPALAIPAALKIAGLEVKDIDSWEVNEAFAAQAVYCVNALGVPNDKLNQRGGAIAIGHPLGCTGARMVSTLFSELKRVNGKYGVISMCIGTGMGAAGIFERE